MVLLHDNSYPPRATTMPDSLFAEFSWERPAPHRCPPVPPFGPPSARRKRDYPRYAGKGIPPDLPGNALYCRGGPRSRTGLLRRPWRDISSSGQGRRSGGGKRAWRRGPLRSVDSLRGRGIPDPGVPAGYGRAALCEEGHGDPARGHCPTRWGRTEASLSVARRPTLVPLYGMVGTGLSQSFPHIHPPIHWSAREAECRIWYGICRLPKGNLAQKKSFFYGKYLKFLKIWFNNSILFLTIMSILLKIQQIDKI